MDQKHSRKAKVLAVSTISAITLGMALVGAESVVRYREARRPDAPGLVSMGLYRHDRLRQALVRNRSYFGWFNVDSNGFRGVGADAESDGERPLKIMAVGGSTTFDLLVTGGDEAAWPARLEHWLSTTGSVSVQVINAGVPGYTVLDNLIRLQTELHEASPDVILLYQSHNDLFEALGRGLEGEAPESDRPDRDEVVTPWGEWLADHSLFYNKLRARLETFRWRQSGQADVACGEACEGDQMLANPGHDATTDPRLERAVAAFERDVRSFVAVAGSLGIPVILVEPQHISGAGSLREPDADLRRLWRHSVGVESDVVLAGYVHFTEALERVAAETEAVFLPTRDFGISGPDNYAPDDPIHYNSRGADAMGRLMAKRLLERPSLITDD